MPLSLGDFSAALTIHSSTRDITVELSGSSIEPPIISASPEYFSLDMGQNEIILDTIAISNTGASDLQFNIFTLPENSDQDMLSREFRNNNKRGRYRSNDRNFKRNGENSKFNSNFSSDSSFQRKSPGKNNHNAPMLIEKYNDLAREALSKGDKILSENYFQHADHFSRVLSEKENAKLSRTNYNQTHNKVGTETSSINSDIPSLFACSTMLSDTFFSYPE